MIQIVKLLIAWALTMPIAVAVALALAGERTRLGSGPSESLLGLGLTIGVPTLVFALVAVWPIAAVLRDVSKPWLYVLGATVLFGAAMLILTAMLMPAGWKGASHALIGFATLLGLIWGIMGALTMRQVHA